MDRQRKGRESTEDTLDRKDNEEGGTGLISERWLRIRPAKRTFFILFIFSNK